MIRPRIILLAMVLPLSVVQAEAQPPSAPPTTPAKTGQYRQAYRDGFQPPAQAADEARKMRELIEKINQTSLPDYRPEPMRCPPRMETKPSAPAATTQPATTTPAVTPKILSNQTLQKLARRVPESVADPIRLGDALYRSGHYTQALFIYHSALEEAKDPEDQLWLYYQMGCCLKDTEPTQAKKYYQQVCTAAPDSPWSDLADIQLQLADWTERNQPTQFLEDLHRDLQPQDERIDASRQAQPRTGGDTQPTGSGVSGSPAQAPATQPAEDATLVPVETITPEPTAISKADRKQ